MLFLALPARATFFIMEGADLLDLVLFRKGTWLALVGSTSIDVLLGKMEDIVYAECGLVYWRMYSALCRLSTEG